MIHRNLIDHLKTILVILVAGDGKEISLALSVSNYKYQLSAKITAIDREGKLCILRIFVYLLEYSSLLFINTDFLSVTIQIYGTASLATDSRSISIVHSLSPFAGEVKQYTPLSQETIPVEALSSQSSFFYFCLIPSDPADHSSSCGQNPESFFHFELPTYQNSVTYLRTPSAYAVWVISLKFTCPVPNGISRNLPGTVSFR